MSIPDPTRATIEDMRDAFERASRHLPVTELHIAPGGVAIRLLVIGSRFVRHIETALGTTEPTADPQITVRVFDAAATDGDVPPPRWPLSAYLARDEIDGSGADGVDASCDVVRRVISLYDHHTSEGIWFAADQANLAPWDSAAPLRNILHWALRDHDLQLAHGAVVGREGAGVLLTAKGGSGKSTTAISLVQAGWQYVADDYCFLATTGTPTAHRLYQVAKLDGASLSRFPELDAAVLNPARALADKAIIDIATAFPEHLADHLALRAVVIPRVDRQAHSAQLVRRAAGDVGRALVPSTMLQLPGCTPDTPRRLANATHDLACYELVIPGDLAGVSQALEPLVQPHLDVGAGPR